MTWKDEFGEEYAVPAEIAGHPFLVDDSWHNNACPTFRSDAKDLTVWVEHPNPAEREASFEYRYAVTRGSYIESDAQVAYTGDDLAEVLAVVDEDCGAPWRGDGGANGLECLLPIGHDGNHRAEWADAEWTEAETKPAVSNFMLPATVHVHVVDGEVTSVHILPSQSAVDVQLFDGDDSPEQLAAVNGTFWAPLAGLPADVVWEG
jgi:hypothetical protein